MLGAADKLDVTKVELRQVDMGIWTVDCEFDQTIRHMQMSDGNFVTALTLRMIPDRENRGVSFASQLTDDEACLAVPFVEKGVRIFQKQRANEGKPIGYLRIELVAIGTDSRGWPFMCSAAHAMYKAFWSHGIEVEG